MMPTYLSYPGSETIKFNDALAAEERVECGPVPVHERNEISQISECH